MGLGQTGSGNSANTATKAQAPGVTTGLVALSTVAAGAAVLSDASGSLGPSAGAAAQNGTLESRRAAARAGLHASLGLTGAMIDQIDQMGIEAWLDQQIAAPNDSSARRFFSSLGFDAINEAGYWRRENYFDSMVWAHLLSGGNSVRRRMALALSEIFVVTVTDLDLPWKCQAVGAYWDILNDFAFGDFRRLLQAITLNPAMGAYLNARGNAAADPTNGRVPDENYAREVMQLFTIGLVQLNLDGTPQLLNGRPIPTYSNADVEGLAKVFTGFDLDYQKVSFVPSPTVGGPVPSVRVVQQSMTSDPTRWSPSQTQSTHSLEEKRFLGTVIRAGMNPNGSLVLALDALANHPNVGPFIGKQLIQRLVTSNPSPEYVARVASVFNNNGKGKRGDLGAVFKAIILDPEASGDQNLANPYFGKVREPMLRFAQWGRAFRAVSKSGRWAMRDLSPETLLNQSPFRSPSVFNFFRPQYAPAMSQSVANGMAAPELQIATDNALASYVNFIHRTVRGTVYWYEDIEPDYSVEIGLASDPLALLNHLDLVLTAGQLGAFTRGVVFDVVSNIPIQASNEMPGRLQRVHEAITLIMCSNDYLVQK